MICSLVRQILALVSVAGLIHSILVTQRQKKIAVVGGLGWDGNLDANVDVVNANLGLRFADAIGTGRTSGTGELKFSVFR